MPGLIFHSLTDLLTELRYYRNKILGIISPEFTEVLKQYLTATKCGPGLTALTYSFIVMSNIKIIIGFYFNSERKPP